MNSDITLHTERSLQQTSLYTSRFLSYPLRTLNSFRCPSVPKVSPTLIDTRYSTTLTALLLTRQRPLVETFDVQAFISLSVTPCSFSLPFALVVRISVSFMRLSLPPL